MKNLFLVLLFFNFSCQKISFNRKLVWFGSSYLPDTSNSVIDSNWYKKHFYLGHYIEISDTGKSILITRASYGEKRECFEIQIDKKTKNKLFAMADEKMYYYNRDTIHIAGTLYCGLNYTIFYQKGIKTNKIQFLPPFANSSLDYLHRKFERIYKFTEINSKISIDTLLYDSLSYQIVKDFPKSRPARLVKDSNFFLPIVDILTPNPKSLGIR